MTVSTLLTQSTKRSQVDQTSSSLVRTHIFTCWCTSTAALNTPRLSFFVYASVFIRLPLSFYFHSTCFSPLLTPVLMGVSFATSLWFLNLFITFFCFERFFGDECQSVLLSLWIQRCWSAEKSWRSLRLLNFSSFLFLYISVSVTLALSFYQPLFVLFTSPSSYRHYSKKNHLCQSFLHFLLIVAMNWWITFPLCCSDLFMYCENLRNYLGQFLILNHISYFSLLMLRRWAQ